jgi:hypothetical protein
MELKSARNIKDSIKKYYKEILQIMKTNEKNRIEK